MPHPFFDVSEYPWSRPEALVFHRALYGAVPVPGRIDEYHHRSGDGLNPLALDGIAPDLIWKDALTNLTAAARLRRLCEVLLDDVNLAGIHDAVRAVVTGGAPPPRPPAPPQPPRTDIVYQSRAYFEAAESQLNGTADKKDLHRWLHHLQDDIYPRLPVCLEQFPESIPELNRHVKTVRRDMAAFRLLAECPTLASLDVEGIGAELDRILEAIQSAIASRTKSPLQEGVSLLDNLRGLHMPEIDGALRDAANNLRLDELARRLQQIADHHPDAGVNSSDVNLALSLHQSTRTGVANHRVWQRIDTQVRLFQQGLTRPIEELTLNWNLLKRPMAERIALEPQAEWAVQLNESIQEFDQQLQANDQSGFRNTFIDIRVVTGERFAQADEQLLADFSALRLIATRIAALLRETT